MRLNTHAVCQSNAGLLGSSLGLTNKEADLEAVFGSGMVGKWKSGGGRGAARR